MQTPRGVSVEPSCLVRNLGVSLVKELTLTTQPTGRPVLRTAAEHQELSTSLDTECSSNDGEQFHRLTNRLLQQSTHGLQSAAIRQAATRPELRRHVRWQTRRSCYSSVA